VTEQPGLLSERWNVLANDWIRWARAPGHDSYWRFHRDAFFKLVPSPGQLTVDIGCGEGRVTRDLRSAGHRVFGLDLSAAMCRATLTHKKRSLVVTADARKLPLPAGTVDCAVAFMSLQDIDNMAVAVREVARVLAPGGSFVIAIIHPMYSGGGFGEGRAADAPFTVSKSYFQPDLCSRTDTLNNLTMTFYREHRPLQDYTDALTDAGFVIEKLNELTDRDQRKPSHRIPMFLDILATLRAPKTAPQNGHSSATTGPGPIAQ
jgi:SAM-dependent methyltransferase